MIRYLGFGVFILFGISFARIYWRYIYLPSRVQKRYKEIEKRISVIVHDIEKAGVFGREELLLDLERLGETAERADEEMRKYNPENFANLGWKLKSELLRLRDPQAYVTWANALR